MCIRPLDVPTARIRRGNETPHAHMTDKERCTAACKDGSPCRNYPVEGSDKCRMHRGTSSDGESHDSNDFAAKAGVWADDFFEGFLTNEEQRRVKEATDVLGDEAGAQEIGRHVAMLAMEQFRRTGDERFLRRFESICDKFAITPADEMNVEGDLSLSDATIDFHDNDT